MKANNNLVGGFNLPTPLKNDGLKVSWGYDIPNMMGKSIQIPWFQSAPTSNGSMVNHHVPMKWLEEFRPCTPFPKKHQ